MNRIIEAIKQDYPKRLDGCICIKRQAIYIPILEIGIEALIRNISELNLFYESVLRLIDVGVPVVSEIGNILGVSDEVMKEVIVDMIGKKLLITSSGHLKMTPQGKIALETRKSEVITKRNVNQLAVNLITGDIYSIDALKITKVNRQSICLHQVISVGKEFVDSHFAQINAIYQDMQVSDDTFKESIVSKELYKILGVAYEKLVYSRSELLIYENRETKDIQILITNDLHEEYVNCVYNQIKMGIYPCLENFFELNKHVVQGLSRIADEKDEILERNTEKFREMLELSEDVDPFNAHSLFCKSRYIIDNKEYSYYFRYFQQFGFEQLIIIGEDLTDILSEVSGDIASIARSRPIRLVFSLKEYKVKGLIDKLSSQIENKNRLSIEQKDDITDIIVCFYPTILIKMVKQGCYLFERPVSYFQGIIEFDREEIEKIIQRVENQNNIILKLNKPSTERTKQRKVSI